MDQTPSSKIQRCNLDGSNRTTIVNSMGTISDIIVDYASNQLFWVNSENHELRTSDLDGTGQRVFIPRPTNPSQNYMERPFGMAKLGNQIFWTEWRTRSLFGALQTGQTSFLIRTISFFKQQPFNIAVVNPLRPGGRLCFCCCVFVFCFFFVVVVFSFCFVLWFLFLCFSFAIVRKDSDGRESGMILTISVTLYLFTCFTRSLSCLFPNRAHSSPISTTLLCQQR